jgi:hypothetical protein
LQEDGENDSQAGSDIEQDDYDEEEGEDDDYGNNYFDNGEAEEGDDAGGGGDDGSFLLQALDGWRHLPICRVTEGTY